MALSICFGTLIKEFANGLQFPVNGFNLAHQVLAGVAPISPSEVLPGAADGKTLVVQEAFDQQDPFNVGATVEALAGFGPAWFDRGELGFPEAQDIGRYPGDITDFTDTEI